MKRKLLWFALFAALVAWFGKDGKAQPPGNPIIPVSVDPTGQVCNANRINERTPNGVIYTCQNGVMAAIGGGGGGSCSGLLGAVIGPCNNTAINDGQIAGATPYNSATAGLLKGDFRSYSINAELSFYSNLASGNQCIVPIIGDSISYGSGASNGSNQSQRSWSYLMMSRLQQAYGYGGPGFISTEGTAIGNLTSTGSWTAVQGVGPSQVSDVTFGEVKVASAAATMQFQFNPDGKTKPIDTIDVYYVSFTDSAAFDINIDSMDQGNFGGGTTGTYTFHKQTFGSLSQTAAHTITLTWVSGKVYFFGFAGRITSGAGVAPMNVSRASATSQMIDGTGPATSTKVAWLATAPTLCGIIVGLSQNDAAVMSPLTPAQVVANYGPLITQAQALSPPVPVLFFLPELSQDSGVATREVAIQTALKNLAISDTYDYVCIADRWGSYATANALGLYADNIHPSNEGHQDVALAMLQYFRPALASTPFGAYASDASGIEVPGFHMGYLNLPFTIDGRNSPEVDVTDLANSHTSSILGNSITSGAFNKWVLTAPSTAMTMTAIKDNQTLNVWGGTTHATQSVTLPASDLICAQGGDATINSLTCTNTVSDAAGVTQQFATSWSQPANFWAAGRSVRLCAQFGIWSSSTAPNYFAQVLRQSVNIVYGSVGALTQVASRSGQNLQACWVMSATDTGAHVFTTNEAGVALLTTSTVASSANGIAQPNNWGTGANTVTIGIQYTATGIASGTYTSGITAVGTVGQTCLLSVPNNGNTGGTATVALTGTNAIAGGTALVITNRGQGSTSAATSFGTIANGTATCTGASATVATVLGGVPGNGVWLQALNITYIN